MGLLPGPDINPRFFGRVLPTLEPHFRKLQTLAPIQDLRSDRIIIWFIPNRCSYACSFTSYSAVCYPINLRHVTAKNAQFWAVFHSTATNSDWIAKWRIGGERACNTASFTYISYCDMIRTQIPNWSKSWELANLWNRPKNHGFGAVRFFDGVKPIATVPVRFQPRRGTEPRIWNRCLHYRKDIDNLLSNIQSTSLFIYGYLLTFLTWRLTINFIAIEYWLVLYQSQRGYISFEVQSCTFIIQFYAMDIFITLYTWLYLVPSLKQVIDGEENMTRLWSTKEVRGSAQ